MSGGSISATVCACPGIAARTSSDQPLSTGFSPSAFAVSVARSTISPPRCATTFQVLWSSAATAATACHVAPPSVESSYAMPAPSGTLSSTISRVAAASPASSRRVLCTVPVSAASVSVSPPPARISVLFSAVNPRASAENAV